MKNVKAMVVLLCLVLIGIPTYIYADMISPVSGDTSGPIVFEDYGSAVDNVRDGDLDSNEYLALGLESSGGGLQEDYTVSFDLGNSYDLEGFYLWNNAGLIQFDGAGVNSFALNFYDSSSSLLGSSDGNALDILARQDFTFDLVSDVQFVDFVIRSNHSPRGYAAFYEISFEGTLVNSNGPPAPAPVPEPATMLLLGTGLFGLAGARRKFKK